MLARSTLPPIWSPLSPADAMKRRLVLLSFPFPRGTCLVSLAKSRVRGLTIHAVAQSQRRLDGRMSSHTVDWYRTKYAARIADNPLLYQLHTGWPKNIDMARWLSESASRHRQAEQGRIMLTIATAVTFHQLIFSPRYGAQNSSRHKVLPSTAWTIFQIQYANGCWPQY